MSSDFDNDNRAISVKDLSKQYQIAHNASSRAETLAETALNLLRRPRARSTRETYWALRDISFDVDRGEVVGIIGRNGAGKSTLLKLLSRITEPTTGQIDLWGRVGSLLEVGTGFHPELTGRENIYLNGAILGMTHREIDAAFDAIVDFAGVEQFLDTPVKRYSSGMYVRLAFAVAAHLNPEILIVDEVLAVGDAEFQQKCLGKMQDVARGGRTVLFVSHHMQSIRLLCDRAIVLTKGTIAYDGPVSGAIAQYMQSYQGTSDDTRATELRSGSGEYRFDYVTPSEAVFEGSDIKTFRWRLSRRDGEGKPERLGRFFLSAHLVNGDGMLVSQCDSRLAGRWWSDADVIEGTFQFKTPWLRPGAYHLDVSICTSSRVVDDYEGACRFDVSPLLPYTFTAAPDASSKGSVLADFDWAGEAK